MNENITVAELRNAKEKLFADVKEAIERFTNFTGLTAEVYVEPHTKRVEDNYTYYSYDMTITIDPEGVFSEKIAKVIENDE